MGARQSNLENTEESSTANNGEEEPCSSKDSTYTGRIPNGSPKRSFKFDDNRPLTSTAFKCKDSDKLSAFVDESDLNGEIRVGNKRKRNTANGDVNFYQAYNETSSIISAPAASPQFTSSHLSANVKKNLSKKAETSDDTDPTRMDVPPEHTTKRLRLDVDDDISFLKSNVINEPSRKSTTDVSIRLFDRLPNLDSTSMNSSRFSLSSGIFKSKPAAQVSLFSLHQKHKTAPSATPYSRPISSLSVISSDTRRLLRDLERKTCSPAVTKQIKTEQRSEASSPQPSKQSETNLPYCNEIDSQKPPVSSLMTPYRANVLPRLATLNKAPYHKVVKETADKGVSADLIGSCFVDESKSSIPYEAKTTNAPKLTSTKSALKLKTVGGARNKFSAHGLEDDEPEVLYDNQLPILPRLPLPDVPASGFLTSSSTIVTPGSPPADSFRFSAPILLAKPSDINSPTALKAHLSPKKPNGNVKMFIPCETADEEVKSRTLKLFSEKPFESVKKSEDATDQWTCSVCFIKNSSEKDKCMACTSLKSAPSKVNINQEQWSCNTCFIKNSANKEKCVACDAQKPSLLKADLVKDKWTCDVCFIKNSQDQEKCLACNGLKPGARLSSTTSNNTAAKTAVCYLNAQSWSCAECYIKVPSDKTHCIACGSPKAGSVISKDISKEEKREEDTKPWNCTTCFIRNPADKVKCMACTTPKPGCTFAPISFGFKPTPPPKPQVETSSFGVQCTPPPEPESKPVQAASDLTKTSSFVPSFGITKQEQVPNEKSAALSETTSKTTTAFSFGFSSSSTTTTPAPSLPQPAVSAGKSTLDAPNNTASAASSTTNSIPSFGFNAPLKTSTATSSNSLFAVKPVESMKEKTETKPETKAPSFTFGADSSSQNKAGTDAVAKPSLFNFGGSGAATTTATALTNTTSSSSLSFNFSSTQSAAPAFGLKTTSSTTSSGFAFNVPISSTSTTSLFGSESALKKSTPLTFGFNSTVAPTATQLAVSTAPSLFAIPATTTAATSKIGSFDFSAASKTSTPSDTLFGKKLTASQPEKNEPAVKPSLFSFGAPTSTAASATNPPLSFNFSAATSSAPAPAPPFGASTESNKTSGGFSFNLPASSTAAAPLFGASSSVSSNATSNNSGGFAFGLPSSNSTPNFQFGGAAAASSTGVNFGAPSPPTLLFGANANTGLGQSTTQPPAATNLFSVTGGSRPAGRKTLTARRTRPAR